MKEATAHDDGDHEADAHGASRIISAVRQESLNHSPEALKQILRTQFKQSNIEISEAEIERVAIDLSRSRMRARFVEGD